MQGIKKFPVAHKTPFSVRCTKKILTNKIGIGVITMIKRKYFSPLAFCAALTCSTLLFSQPALANAGISETEVWPDLYEISINQQSSEIFDTKDTPSLPTSLREHPYTKEELDDIFRGLPQYLESGSFLLNRLNGLPKDPTDNLQIDIDGTFYPLRPSWEYLTNEITSRLNEYQGDWSVYIKDLSTGKTMEINEHSMESASLIKLYIAGAIYEQLDARTLTEDDTMDTALTNMIVVSDNESSNVLVRYLCDESGDFQSGLAKVNDFIQRNGFTNTEQVNGIADPSLWVSDGRVNMTSAADCGRILEMIYNRELASHFYSFRFEVLLNKQEVNYKIPAALPQGTHISHKTGEVDDTENDAAIIYTPMGDYIFCIMSTDLTDTGSAVDHIHEISRLVYDYFTTPTLKYYLVAEEVPETAKYVIVEEASY